MMEIETVYVVGPHLVEYKDQQVVDVSGNCTSAAGRDDNCDQGRENAPPGDAPGEWTAHHTRSRPIMRKRPGRWRTSQSGFRCAISASLCACAIGVAPLSHAKAEMIMTRPLLFWVIAIALFREPADILPQTLVAVLLEGSVSDVYTWNGYLQGATIIVTSHQTGKVVTTTTD